MCKYCGAIFADPDDEPFCNACKGLGWYLYSWDQWIEERQERVAIALGVGMDDLGEISEALYYPAVYIEADIEEMAYRGDIELPDFMRGYIKDEIRGVIERLDDETLSDRNHSSARVYLVFLWKILIGEEEESIDEIRDAYALLVNEEEERDDVWRS